MSIKWFQFQLKSSVTLGWGVYVGVYVYSNTFFYSIIESIINFHIVTFSNSNLIELYLRFKAFEVWIF